LEVITEIDQFRRGQPRIEPEASQAGSKSLKEVEDMLNKLGSPDAPGSVKNLSHIFV